MTPEEKTQVLGTIEKLMNEIVKDNMPMPHPYDGEAKLRLAAWFASEFPNIVWHWESERAVVTDFIQKEI
jgi:hypothetical protein